MVHGIYAQTPSSKEPPHFRFTLSGGYSYRLGKIPENFPAETKSYMRKLKSGFNVSADALYYFNETFGAGAKYSRFQRNHSDVTTINYGGGTMRTNVADNISINFIAATFATRVFNFKKTNSFHANLSVGYLGYKDKGFVYRDHMTLTGGTVGFGWDMGYDIRISRKLSAGAQASLITGKLSSVTREDASGRSTITLKDDQKENLSHVNLSLGLRLNI